MQEGIHPKYQLTTVHCACGYSFQTRSTKDNIHVEICSNCHPFFTGKQKLVDTAGRMERFTKRFEKTSGKTLRVKAKVKVAAKAPVQKLKVLSTGARKTKAAEKKEPVKKTIAPKSK